MLTIRKKQFEAISKAYLKDFEMRLVRHFFQYFPNICVPLGRDLVRKFIQYGIMQAKKYNYVTERDICLYISLMFLLGSDFDQDPQVRWAGSELEKKKQNRSSMDISELYDETIKYLNDISGENGEYITESLIRMRTYDLQDIEKQIELPLNDRLFDLLATIYPQKFEYQDEAAMRQLIDLGIKKAEYYEITKETGIGLIVGLMFILGYGFDQDIQYTRINSILNDLSIQNQEERIDKLHKKIILEIDRIIN